MKIEKDQKIWTPDEAILENGDENPRYEQLFCGDEINEPVILELNKTIMILEVETAELTVNPPRALQMLAARGGKGTVEARSTKYFAQCCNIPLTAFEEMSGLDFNRIGLVLANFTER